MEQTDNCQGGGRGDWMTDSEGISPRTYICMAHGHRQQCGVARGKGARGWKWAKGGGMGTSAIVLTGKIRF